MKTHELIVSAAASEISEPNGGLPLDVQWMPPGSQKVHPFGVDEPFHMNVSKEMAAKADQQLQKLRSAHASGVDVQPYGDFNHKDEGRSFLPKHFFWGGDDAKEGGIRMELDWTGAGARSVRDGELCCVSASWVLHKETKEFLGIQHNVGGLVPRSAFHSIQAFAKADSGRHPGGSPTPTHQHQMTDQEKQLADLTTALATLTETVTAQAAELNEVKAKATTTPAPPAAPAAPATPAVDPKIIDLEKEVKALKDARTAEAKAIAERAVAAAAAAGKFAPQDKAMFDHLVTVYCASPQAGQSILDKMQVNPALVTIVNGKAVTATGNGTDAEEFKKLVSAKAKEITKVEQGRTIQSMAVDAAMAEKPELYQAWRAADGQPSL